MYCNCKVLIIFGFIFWIALYVSDMYFMDPRSKVVTEGKICKFRSALLISLNNFLA